MSNALKEQYAKVVTELRSGDTKLNAYAIPRIDKVVVNVGIGSHKDDKTYKETVVENLAQITGQRPIVVQARASIAGFKLREGQDVGAKVTLRGTRAQDFFYRLVHIVLPRVRDFRGLPRKGFDGHGNYTIGLPEHTVFPEISESDASQTHPLEITIVTTGDSDDAASDVFAKLGFPFQSKAGEAAAAREQARDEAAAKEQRKAEKEAAAAAKAAREAIANAKEEDGA